MDVVRPAPQDQRDLASFSPWSPCRVWSFRPVEIGAKWSWAETTVGLASGAWPATVRVFGSGCSRHGSPEGESLARPLPLVPALLPRRVPRRGPAAVSPPHGAGSPAPAGAAGRPLARTARSLRRRRRRAG